MERARLATQVVVINEPATGATITTFTVKSYMLCDQLVPYRRLQRVDLITLLFSSRLVSHTYTQIVLVVYT